MLALLQSLSNGKMMKKRWLPVPLILLTPILLLVVVIVAGVYRFSLSDEQILAKYPSSATQSDAIVTQLFTVNVAIPLTLSVPDTSAFALIEHWDGNQRWAYGTYDSGRERGQIALDSQTLIAVQGEETRKGYAGVVRVSPHDGEVMAYLALFQYDDFRLRMVMVDTQPLGHHVEVQSVTQRDDRLIVALSRPDQNDAQVDTSTQFMSILFLISQKYQLIPQ